MRLSFLLALALVLTTCTPRAKNHDFPTKVDTRTQPIAEQEKRRWTFAEAGLTVDNQFDGARLSRLEQTNDTLFTALILPENEPINPSPWYAFRLTSDRDQRVTVRLSYPRGVNHRYAPDVSTDRKTWRPLPDSLVTVGEGQFTADVALDLRAGQPTYLAAQEVINSADVADWVADLARQHRQVRPYSAGKSKLGRNIPAFSVSQGEPDDRPTIVLLSRQHPPEVTGYLALQAFLDGLLNHGELTELLTRYQFLVYPLLNPDGVDLGHWRHTAGGIDSNRDWARYRQPEARRVANDIVLKTEELEAKVVLGMDFHSTYRDVYYTHPAGTQPPTALPGFKDAWLAAIEKNIGGTFRINEDPGPIDKPTSASWFRTQFGAEGITYEIGDATARSFVRRKGEASADALVSVLLAIKGKRDKP